MLGLRRILATRDERDRRRHAAMRDRNSCVCCCGHSSRYARYDLEGDSRARERLRFLAAAPEHEWIAALEPYDALSLQPEAHEQRIDLLLARRLAAAATLTHEVYFDIGIQETRRR